MDAVINPDNFDKTIRFTPGFQLCYDVDPHGDVVPVFEQLDAPGREGSDARFQRMLRRAEEGAQ